MPRWTETFGRTALSVAILSGGILVYLFMQPPEMKPRRAEVDKPVRVETEQAVRHTNGVSIDVDGVVVPFRQIELAAEISGKIALMSASCQVGRTVKAGELLLRIEPDDYELEVRRLNEELSQADAMTKELKAEIQASINQIGNAEQQLQIEVRQLARNSDLMSRGAASASEVDSARRSELATRTSLQSLIDEKNVLAQRAIRMEAAKSLVQANLEKAELSLGRTEIFAPFDAVVVEQSVEKESYVQPGNSVVVLQETTSLDVACKLQMKEMNWLWQGSERAVDESAHEFPKTPATVIYELSGRQFFWKAMVDRYDGAGVDNQTRMISCRVHVPEPASVMASSPESQQQSDAKNVAPNTGSPDSAVMSSGDKAGVMTGVPTLMTGMFVKVHIHTSPPISLLRIPQQAVQPEEKVWVVDGNVLMQKTVTIAYSTDDYAVVIEQPDGLKAGDSIIVSPLAQPSVGMKVVPVGGPARPAGNEPPTGGQPAVTSGGP